MKTFSGYLMSPSKFELFVRKLPPVGNSKSPNVPRSVACFWTCSCSEMEIFASAVIHAARIPVASSGQRSAPVTHGLFSLTSLCTCSHVRCNVPHVFWTRSHIHLEGGGQCYRVHLLTCSMSRSTHFPGMITHTFG